jgi:ATP phosphoribosyltransferase regulatory subunit
MINHEPGQLGFFMYRPFAGNPLPTHAYPDRLDMSIADRWLLPDGIEELLPIEAARAEALRRRLLDIYARWGYELVEPPLVEFLDSLLVNGNHDLDLQTCKVTDQLSGRLMGVRADITPQTARIDAHGLNREGATRLCYSGPVLHARPKTALASRTPIQVGCELYGVSGMDADCEVMCLMLATAAAAGIQGVTLDLGHVAVFRGLARLAELDAAQEEELFDILQRKAIPELHSFVANTVKDNYAAGLLLSLPTWRGERAVLTQAAAALIAAPDTVRTAVTELEQLADALAQRAPGVTLYFDLSELRGYHYHTGAVFALYVAGCGEALANGGRYDEFGAAFGRSRPASGFSADIKHLMQHGSLATPTIDAVWVALDANAVQWEAITALREQGECVITGRPGDTPDARCGRELVAYGETYITRAIAR